ncbi:MAG: DUF748 domain-containing protein [Rhodospirillales bacterium]|jgi:hypothetical protein
MKKAFIGVGVLVVVIGIGGYIFFSLLDSIIKTAVEKYGSEITQTKVTLNEVELSVTSGKGALRGFTLGNPKGFDTESAMKFGEVSITVDPTTVTSDVIVIKEVRITGPQVTYELGSGGSNFDAIQKNVESYTGGSGKPAAKEEKKDDGKKGPKLIIENLYITGGKVGVSASFLKGKTLDGTLPDIHLKDIGKEKKKEPGATPAEVAKKIMDSISSGASKAVSALNIDGLTKSLKAAADGAMEKLKSGGGDVLAIP